MTQNNYYWRDIPTYSVKIVAEITDRVTEKSLFT
jgi:hypothetical protein